MLLGDRDQLRAIRPRAQGLDGMAPCDVLGAPPWVSPRLMAKRWRIECSRHGLGIREAAGRRSSVRPGRMDSRPSAWSWRAIRSDESLLRAEDEHLAAGADGCRGGEGEEVSSPHMDRAGNYRREGANSKATG